MNSPAWHRSSSLQGDRATREETRERERERGRETDRQNVGNSYCKKKKKKWRRGKIGKGEVRRERQEVELAGMVKEEDRIEFISKYGTAERV